MRQRTNHSGTDDEDERDTGGETHCERFGRFLRRQNGAWEKFLPDCGRFIYYLASGSTFPGDHRRRKHDRIARVLAFKSGYCIWKSGMHAALIGRRRSAVHVHPDTCLWRCVCLGLSHKIEWKVCTMRSCNDNQYIMAWKTAPRKFGSFRRREGAHVVSTCKCSLDVVMVTTYYSC